MKIALSNTPNPRPSRLSTAAQQLKGGGSINGVPSKNAMNNSQPFLQHPGKFKVFRFGLVVMSDMLNTLLTSLFNNSVPSAWASVAPPSLMHLAGCAVDIEARLHFMNKVAIETISYGLR